MLKKSPKIGIRERDGRNQDQLSDKEFIIRIFQIMSFLSGVVTLGILFSAIYFQFDTVYIIFSLMVPVIFFIIFLLDLFKKNQLSKICGTTLLPTWINIATLCGGGDFSETPVMLAFVIFAYVLYARKPDIKYRIIAFNVICHVGVLTYLSFYPPIIRVVNFPFDEVVVFFIALGWIYVFLTKYEYEKNKLVVQLQKKNKELLGKTEELERFTHIASHDLKSPLRTIISFSDLTNIHLRKGDLDKVKEDLNFIRSGAKQMNYLIGDILEFSRINGKKEIEKNELDLNEILEKVEHNLLDETQEKKAKIVKQKLPSYYGNKTEFMLLFQNLLQNGIKYNSSTIPVIQIWSSQSDTAHYIYVKDNGIGIDPNYHDQIFQLFKRLHTSEIYQGTGLGLGLCKKLIEKYNGKISVESELGMGATFTVELPILGAYSKFSNQEEPIESLSTP